VPANLNPLEASGKPLFFRVADADRPEIGPRTARAGIAVRVAARSLSLMQKEAVVTGPDGISWRVSSDEGGYLLGDDVAPCPLAHMATGMVASFMDSLLRTAAAEKVNTGRVRLILDNFYTMQGSALRGTMIGGALPVELTLETDQGSKSATSEPLLQEAVRRAPVSGLIEQALKSRFTLTHNGRRIPTGRVDEIDEGAPPVPSGRLDLTRVAPGDWSSLVIRNGLSPVSEEITSSSGSSFAEEQSRRLHVRGICTVDSDGVKTIEQQLFNPHGTIFHFRSDEGPSAGGMARAPDALSFVSAGIAFCFMTQIGRYAKIARKLLNEYAIVQDTRFSNSPDGHAVAKPVETHVYLTSDEDDEFARAALDMSEQTCFLHALARSRLQVNTRARPGDF
jgi:uncharacterized OsmC-like protein